MEERRKEEEEEEKKRGASTKGAVWQIVSHFLRWRDEECTDMRALSVEVAARERERERERERKNVGRRGWWVRLSQCKMFRMSLF